MSPSESPSASPSISPSASPSATAAQIQYSMNQWKGIYLVKWEGLLSESTGRNIGTPFACPSYPIKSIQIYGTFSGGAVCSIEGSNMPDKDTASYQILRSPQGIAITPTDNMLRTIQDNTYWVRPNVSGGDGSTDIDVYLLCVTER